MARRDDDGILEALRVIHAEVDDAVRPLARRHAARLACRSGCRDCCVDDLTVFEVEAERIRAAHPDLLARGQPHPAGACAFLDGDGSCRVYPDRPYVCRTQGLPLRWLDDTAEGRIEYRDICPLNETDDEPLERLTPDECWTLGPFEGRLASLQAGRGDPPRRVALRDLFRRWR